MNDDVFNTLLAVLALCTNHFNGDLLKQQTNRSYDKGFEQCTVITQAVAKESAVREAKKEADALQRERDRVANAIAALHGQKFKPDAPLPQQIIDGQWINCGCSPITGIHPN